MKQFEKFIGKQVIIRANLAGVFFGTLDSVETKDSNVSCIISNARKLYKWSGALAIEDIATNGVDFNNCKFTCIVNNIGITNIIQIIPCTNKSINNINLVKEWKN